MRNDQPADPDSKTPMESGPGFFRALNANVIRLGIVSFLADVSSEMLYPVTPLFLVLLGAPVWGIGFIEGAAEATASLLKTVAGRLSDRSGRRRPYVFGGYAVSACAKPLIGLAAFALGWPLVLAARVADRLGKGLRGSPRDAWLAESVEPTSRGAAFGWHRGMDSLGAVVGPLLALLALSLLGVKTREQLALLFALAFIPGMLGALLVLTVRERRQPPAPSGTSIRFRALPPAFRAYLIAWGAFAVANSSDVFLILRANDILGKGMTATMLVIAIYAFYNLVYALGSPVLGHLSDTLGRKRALIAGLVVFAAVYAGFALVGAAWQIWVLFGVYGLYTAATDGVGKALAVDLVPGNIKASAVGLLGTVTGLATLAASVIAGLLWGGIGGWRGLGPWAAFAYGAAGALAGALLLARLRVAPPAETAPV